MPGVSFCNTLSKTFKFRRNIPKGYSNLSVGNTFECHGTNKKVTTRLTILYKNKLERQTSEKWYQNADKNDFITKGETKYALQS